MQAPPDSLIACKVCSHAVSRSAEACPNCGQSWPGIHVKCPQCESQRVQIGAQGLSAGKAAVGGLLFGPIGFLSAALGKDNVQLTCTTCQHRWLPSVAELIRLTHSEEEAAERLAALERSKEAAKQKEEEAKVERQDRNIANQRLAAGITMWVLLLAAAGSLIGGDFLMMFVCLVFAGGMFLIHKYYNYRGE